MKIELKIKKFPILSYLITLCHYLYLYIHVLFKYYSTLTDGIRMVFIRQEITLYFTAIRNRYD